MGRLAGQAGQGGQAGQAMASRPAFADVLKGLESSRALPLVEEEEEEAETQAAEEATAVAAERHRAEQAERRAEAAERRVEAAEMRAAELETWVAEYWGEEAEGALAREDQADDSRCRPRSRGDRRNGISSITEPIAYSVASMLLATLAPAHVLLAAFAAASPRRLWIAVLLLISLIRPQAFLSQRIHQQRQPQSQQQRQ